MARRILDLYSGAGGAAFGYNRAGFYPYGIDTQPQPRYPFPFLQGDALSALRILLSGGSLTFGDEELSLCDFSAVHASPPCQAYSSMSKSRPGLADEYPKLIGATRVLMMHTGLPYVIENVEGARKELRTPTMLCGQMFDYEIYRHRLFETNFYVIPPPHPDHETPASRAGHWTPGTIMSVAGHVSPISKAREIMAIDWMSRDELAEAIPPYYSAYIGRELAHQL